MNEPKNSLSVVTILPPPNQNPGSVQMAQGTKVMLSNGSELSRVQSVTLSAKAGGMWEATITVLPEIIQPVNAEAHIVEVEVTDLKSRSRTHTEAE